jgi:hypothetical protein
LSAAGVAPASTLVGDRTESDALAGRAEGAPLDLHEGISDPAAGGCPRWPEGMRLVNSLGEVVRGRCRSTNLCDYCAKLAAVENAECLALDARLGKPPEIWAVLTTADANPDPSSFYRSREQLWKAVRRRWPDAEYAALVEFTTGYGPRSGGVRRPHWNLLPKGVPSSSLDEFRRVVSDVWCARENAKVPAQYFGCIEDVEGLMRYIALHFQKESQSPPKGWRGHRFLKSRGYFGRPMPEVRAEARRDLRFRRELWKFQQRNGDDFPDEAEASATQALALFEALEWKLVIRDPSTADLTPQREAC